MRQRHVLTKYRLSDHNLAIETGRHRKNWLPREQRICGHCETGMVETEEHFLLHCGKYKQIRESLFPKLHNAVPSFPSLNNRDKMAILLGEGPTAAMAAQYILQCHELRDSSIT